MTPNNPTDDFDFDDLPDLPLLEDEGSPVPDTTQEPVAAQSEEDEGVDLPELTDLGLPEISAIPSIESVQPALEEAAPVAEPEPDMVPAPVRAEATPSKESELEESPQLVPEQSTDPAIAEDEQHADAVAEEVVPHVQAISLTTDEGTFSDVELAEFEPASQAEQPPSDEPTDEVPFVEEDPSQAHNAPLSRKPLIIGGAVAAVLAIGIGAFVFWPSAEPQAPVEANVSAPSNAATSSSSAAPAAGPEHELTTADMVSDVLSDQPQVEPTPESVVQPSAPEESTPEVHFAAPAPVAVKSEPAPAPAPTPAAKPAAVVEKPTSASAQAKPAKKPAPQKTEPAKAQDNKWQDEALNALDAFEKGL